MKRPQKAPKYCKGYIDRHGCPRWYLRKPGLPGVALPGLPWSPEFMAAYQDALTGEPAPRSAKAGPGTIDALAMSYFQSADFACLRPSTKTTYRGIIERFREDHGGKRVAALEAKHVRKIIGDRSATPAAANNLLRMIKLLMRHAVEQGWRRDDPTDGVRKLRVQSTGFTTWEEEHVDQFLAAHAPDSRAVLALTLLLYTGQRRSDVVRMGRQHVRDGLLTITQQKTGTTVHVPVLRPLQSVLDALPRDNLTFLTTAHGKPFTPAGFTNWFRDMTQQAGLPKGLSPHGLRKATARRLAEHGRSANEIMAVLGHAALAEASRYTAAADRKRLAGEAMRSLDSDETRTKIV